MRYLMIALILLISSNVSGKESEVRPLLPHGLTDKEVSDLTGPALDGSGDAAWRLAQVYMIAPYVPEKLKYWSRIAAENGNPYAQFTYAEMFLLTSDDENDRRRAMYWLNAASKQGVQRATELLQKIERSKINK